MAYETVIGLEVHAELATRSKMFCGCPTTFGRQPNTQCCPVCLGLPGALPVLNQAALEFAIRVCLATHCQIASISRFDRKNYFYPDLPKSYQISQRYLPIGTNGYLVLPESERVVRIREIHMEEDAGKLNHDIEPGYTLIDYNRSGIPLLEIVSEPDLSSSEEALAFMEALRGILLFLCVSDCRMQEGSFRADVNVSVRPSKYCGLGTRTEIKNMNSYKAIRRAIDAESQRQIEFIKSGLSVRQETRRFDEQKGESLPMRSKENVMDYRYFPDPDLADLKIDDAFVDEIRAALPELPESKRKRYQTEFGLSTYEAFQLTSDPALSDLFEATTALSGKPKDVASWIMGEVLKACRARDCPPDALPLPPPSLAALVNLVSDQQINRTIARKVFQQVLDHAVDPVQYIEEHGLQMKSSPADLRQYVADVLKAHPESVQDYQAGKKKVIRFLIGQVMRHTGGKADPKVVESMIIEALDASGPM